MTDEVAPTREKTVLMLGTKTATVRARTRTDAAMPTWTGQRKGAPAQVSERIDLRRRGGVQVGWRRHVAGRVMIRGDVP